MKIKKSISIGEFAALVASALAKHGIDTVLSGGAVVSIYTDNLYQSYDVDFISPNHIKKIESAMEELGFERKGKMFVHPGTKSFVEFPTGPLAVGQLLLKPEKQIKIKGHKLTLLSPTQAVMDRLCGYFFWNDRQSLEQALWIAQKQPIKLSQIRKWSQDEGEESKFNEFLNQLKHSPSTP